MKVAIVLFPLGFEGGLSTRSKTYYDILKRNGHIVQFFRIAYSDRLHGRGYTEPVVQLRSQFIRLAQNYLSITDEKIGETLLILNTFDVIIFPHPSPHTSHTQRAVRNWPRLYLETRARKVAYFSDVYFDKYYPHFVLVAHTAKLLATSTAALNYIRPLLPGLRVVESVHAFALTDIGVPPPPEKTLDIVWPHAWRGWKGIEQMVRAVPDLRGSVEFYGGGREESYYTEEIKNFSPTAKIMGVSDPAVVMAAYRRARVSVDLTGLSKKYYGHFNRASIEPMFYGCVLCCLDTLVDPWSTIPRECVNIVRKNKLAEDLNSILAHEDTRIEIAVRAWAWASREFSDQRILLELLT